MKTFKQFMCENEEEELPKLRKKIKELNQRGLTIPPALLARATELAQNANVAAKLTRKLLDKPEKEENPNSKVVGYASKDKDVVSRAGTTSDVQRTDLPSESDTLTGSRYAKPGSSGSRGTNTARSGGDLGSRKR